MSEASWEGRGLAGLNDMPWKDLNKVWVTSKAIGILRSLVRDTPDILKNTGQEHCASGVYFGQMGRHWPSSEIRNSLLYPRVWVNASAIGIGRGNQSSAADPPRYIAEDVACRWDVFSGGITWGALHTSYGGKQPSGEVGEHYMAQVVRGYCLKRDRDEEMTRRAEESRGEERRERERGGSRKGKQEKKRSGEEGWGGGVAGRGKGRDEWAALLVRVCEGASAFCLYLQRSISDLDTDTMAQTLSFRE
ncbi:hypothetical protein AAG570_006881 [Ranatra chinensis]|uniref:Uncharacterized protein n=1 Tax=Ranatra chinensis TaxID=642074 RepID=A0ABD0ZIN9_9HEMI